MIKTICLQSVASAAAILRWLFFDYSLFIGAPIVSVFLFACFLAFLCYVVLSVLSSFAIISLMKKQMLALV